MSGRVLVVADDFTGGNAAAAGFSAVGHRAITVLAERLSTFDEIPARFDVVVVSTATRHANAADASEVVRDVLGRSGRPAIVSLRVDSTLRGPIGASTHAALGALRESTGRRVVALCVPAYPDAGRHTIDGHQFLDGVDISQTELAREALDPITSSSVIDALWVEGQSCGLITLDTVAGDETELLAALAAMVAEHDVVVVDASTPEHLASIARAVSGLPPEIDVLGVDSGPFSVAWATSRRELDHPASCTRAPVLGVIGSPSELTAAQLNRLRAERVTTTITAEFDKAGSLCDPSAAVTALRGAVQGIADGGIILLAAAWAGDPGSPMAVTVADHIVQGLATLTRALMSEQRVGGIFCTGGDMTEALLSQWGARGVVAEEEVVPLAVAGTVSGGAWDGLPLVTKGGMVGDGDAILRCVEKLERRMTEHNTTIPPRVAAESDRVKEPHD